MCTVTVFRANNGFILTSNRDEHIGRVVQSKPVIQSIQNIHVLFPKDPLAGGTWFATNEMGATAVLLNGAFTRHVRKESYRLSRGIVLLNVLNTSDPLSSLRHVDLDNIEPFTLILLSRDELTEFRWDGVQKHFRFLEKNTPHIYSSSTLYDENQRNKREKLFAQFLRSNTVFDAKNIFDFHSQTNDDLKNGFVMQRSPELRTLSITQVITDEERSTMKHFDLLGNEEYHSELQRMDQHHITNRNR